MRVAGLLVLVAVVLVAVLGFCLWHPAASSTAIAPSPAPELSPEPADDLAAVPFAPASAEERAIAATTRTSAASDDGSHAQTKHEFDVTFVVVDALGRPRADTAVGFAVDRHRANDMGHCDAKGELHVTWRGELSEIDGVFGCMSKGADWSRVHLVAGRPCTLRLSAEPLRAPASIPDLPGGTVNAVMHDSGPADLPFERDADGNGVFVDPDMLVREVQESPWRGQPSPFSSRKLGGSGRSHHQTMATIDCIARDVDGRPAPSTPLRQYVGGSTRGDDARTDANGHFVLVRPANGSVDLEFGGGIFAMQRKTFDLALGDQTWNVQLTRLPVILGKLMDPDEKPLSGWHVQAREDHPPFGFLQSCDTDAAGNFSLGVDHGGTARLLVKPPESDDRPAMMLADHVSAGQVELVVQMRDPSRRVSVKWHFDMPWQFRRVDAVARVMRVDSGDCVWLDPHEVTKTDDGFVRWTFLFDRALPGEYQIVNFGPAGRSELGVHLGNDEEELGNIPLEPTMTIVLVPDDVGESEAWSAQVLTSAQGIRVRSIGASDAATYLIPAGDAELVVNTSVSAKPLRKALHGRGGERIEIPFSALRHNVQAGADPAPARSLGGGAHDSSR